MKLRPALVAFLAFIASAPLVVPDFTSPGSITSAWPPW